jgi:acyl-CoA dehydrogenase family protein 9
VLWRIINDTIQIFGGKAYFADEPYERMMRDGRINMIGEGANDVLRVFSALVGLRDVGMELKGVLDALMNPLGNISKIGGFASRRIGSMLSSPEVKVRSTELQDDATRLGRLIGSLGSHVERLLRKYQESIMDRQYQLARVADVATELYVSSCVLNRLDALVRDPHADEAERLRGLKLGRYYLKTAGRRINRNLADMWDNDDDDTTRLANMVVGK